VKLLLILAFVLSNLTHYTLCVYVRRIMQAAVMVSCSNTDRNRAWLLYSVIQQYTDVDSWHRALHKTFQVPDDTITQFRVQKQGNFQEQQHLCLKFWINKEKLGDFDVMVYRLEQFYN